MKAKRNTLSSALSFFNDVSSGRSSSPTLARAPLKTGTSTSSLRSFQSLPETVPSFSSNQNYLLDSNFPKFRDNSDDATDVDYALNLFRQMAAVCPLPSIVEFNKLLSRILKMRHYSLVVSLYQEMRNTGIPISTYTLSILIDACCRSNRVDCGFCVLGIYFKYGIEFNVVAFTTLIKGLCLENKIVDAVELFRKLVREKVCEINEVTCGTLINGLCKRGHTQTALDLLGVMQKEGPKPNTIVYSTIIDALCKDRMVDEALDLLYEMIGRGIPPNTITYAPLINGLCLDNRIGEAVELFRKLVRENVCKIDQVTCGILITGLCKTGYTQTALDLLGVMQNEGLEPNTRVYNNVIDALCKDRMIDEALDLLTQMIGIGILPDKFTYASLIQGLCNFCRWKEVTKLMNEMVLRNLCPDARIFTILVDAFSKEGKLNDAEAIIQIMIQRKTYPDVVTYNTLIEGYCLQGQMDEARKAFSRMVDRGLQPDVWSYNILINGYCRIKEMDEAMDLFREIPENGLCPGVVTYTTILQGLFLVGRCSTALKLFQEMQVAGHKPNFHTSCVLLKGLCDNGHVEKAMSIYSKLDKNGNGSHVFGNIMIDAFCKTGLLNIARGIFINLSNVSCTNVNTYTIMINGFFREGLTDEALYLLRRMKENDILPDTATCNVILSEFVRKKMCNEANMVLDEMVGMGISPNGYTLSLVNDLLALQTANSTVLRMMQKFAANDVQ
ncbi:PREDICTED: pentatricopeptide repeat-containing protein At1g63330-like [Ipomoea nil]|uniref:pentatricopeptide repeat-containing protein At1g63330-like n=1 Tax=Ipomoea nil TaxID=35883 RepID=UPI000901F5C3|nr:PREDICTED: pentatricopeptide repeat-containing protein At1g63330-like [Ipomoea nil]